MNDWWTHNFMMFNLHPLQKKDSETAFLKCGHRAEKRGLSTVDIDCAQSNRSRGLHKR